jgi:hypothetical protein
MYYDTIFFELLLGEFCLSLKDMKHVCWKLGNLNLGSR